MKRRIITTVLGIMAAVSLAGCSTGKAPESTAAQTQAQTQAQAQEPAGGAEAADEQKTVKVGVSLYNMNNPHFVLMAEAIEEQVAARGGTVVVVDPLKDNAKQVSDIEDLISQGCDVIICAAVDARGLNVALKTCQNEGVPVINVDMPVEDTSLVASVIATDNYEAGYVLGEAMIKETGGQAKIGLLERVESQAIRSRVEGFEAAIKDQPGMEIVIRQSCMTTTEDALPVVENFLQSNPEITDMFFGNDMQLLGGVNACKAGGRTDIRLYGIDGSENGMKLVQEGKAVGTSAQFPVRIGETAVEYAYKVLNGEGVEEKTLIPSIFIDKTNVDEYIKIYQE